ncbi:membrane protein, partial [Salmonella enterica subsp. enterica serovar Typhimurium]
MTTALSPRGKQGALL